MTVLLDTHTFLWAIDQPAKLSRKVTSIITNEENALVISTASLWEITVKLQAGKLRVAFTAEYFDAHRTRLGVNRILPISPAHVLAILKLPPLHKDPFDRLLASQCIVEGFPLLSADSRLRDYPIEVIW